MTTQNYLMIQNSVVTNLIIWDGDTTTWTPPSDVTMVLKVTTVAVTWVLNSDKTDWILTEVLGAGDIGFTWDGLIVTTNQPKPAAIVQPTTSGLKPA